MAIQFTDFSKAPLNTQESPLSSVFENVLKGYKMQQEPAKMAAEQKQKNLANSLKAKALEHYDETYSLDKQLKQARINKLNSKSPTGMIKPNGKTANIAWVEEKLKDPNISPEYADKLRQSLTDAAEHEESITANNKDRVAGNAFDKQPINDKKESVAKMRGMGVDTVEAVRYLRKPDSSPEAYAKEHNIDINQVEKKYAPTEQNIKMAQQAVAYMDELDELEKHISAGLGKYQNKMKGYSFQQIADAAKNEDPETQGMVLAARALFPELSAIRGKLGGANIGIEFLKEMEAKSLGNLNIFESLVSPEAYAASQKYMNAWLKEAGLARSRSLMGNSMLKTQLQKGAEKESGMGNDPLGLY